MTFTSLDMYFSRTKVASSHGDHTVRVSDIATGKIVRTLEGHPRTPWCLTYHPSSSHILASGCLGGQVRIWDLYVSVLLENNEYKTELL